MTLGWSTTILDFNRDFSRDYTGILDLYHEVGDPLSPVAHPEWVSSWWATRPREVRARCFTAYHKGHLRVCIPLEFAVEHFAGLRVRKVTSTNLSWGWTSALIHPDAPGDWASLFCDWLLHDAPHWSVIELGAFPRHWRGVAQLVDEMAGRNWLTESFSRDMAVLRMPDTMDGFLQSHGKNLRKTNNRVRRRCAEAGVRVRSDWPADARTILTYLGTVSQVSWQGQHHSSVFLTAPEFYRELAARQDEILLGLTSVTTAENRPIGYLLSTRIGSVVHAIDTGFDPAAAEFSPGVLSHMETIDRVIAAGASTLDLGEMAEYKARYRPEVAPGVQLLAARSMTAMWARTVRRWHQRS